MKNHHLSTFALGALLALGFTSSGFAQNANAPESTLIQLDSGQSSTAVNERPAKEAYDNKKADVKSKYEAGEMSDQRYENYQRANRNIKQRNDRLYDNNGAPIEVDESGNGWPAKEAYDNKKADVKGKNEAGEMSDRRYKNYQRTNRQIKERNQRKYGDK